MKKVLVFLCAVTLVFGVTGMAQAILVDYTETGASLSDNTFDDMETYHFLGGVDLGPGVYDLEFELAGVAYQDDIAYGWESGQDVFYVEVYLGCGLIASVTDNSIDGQYAPFYFDIDFVTEGGTLNIYSWADVSTPAEHWGLVVANLEGTGTPVPEPATMLLLGSGLVGLAAFSRKKWFRK